MAVYRYKAKSGPGRVVEGELEARSPQEAAARLDAQGLYPVSVIAVDVRGSHTGRIRSNDIIAFTGQLATLVNSGAPLAGALTTLQDETEQTGLRSVIARLIEQIRDGQPFSGALQRYPQIFSDLYVSLIRAGELSGTLGENLRRIAGFLEEERDFRTHLISILVYPLFILAVGILTVVILLRLLVPKLAGIFGELGQELPSATRWLVGLSELSGRYWPALVLLAGAGVYGARMLWKEPRYRLLFDRWRLRAGIFGEIWRRMEIYHLSRTLALLLRNGVSIGASLQTAGRSTFTSVFREELEGVGKDIEQGMTLHASLARRGIFPKPFVNVVTVGEESGTLASVLETAAADYNKDINRRMRILMSALEPLLILCVGVIVMFVIVAMLLPIFEIDFTF